MSRTIQIVASAITLLAALFIADAWRTAHRNSVQLTATLAAQNALIQQASAREQQRNAELAAALASIATEKKHVQTPQQAADAIPSVLPPLPLPIKISLPDLAQSPEQGGASPASISIPQADLKPLYDGLQDCRACALERDATKKDLADERTRVTALIRERDAAVATAHGGNFWSRLKHTTKWFVIGAAAGAAASAASHHWAGPRESEEVLGLSVTKRGILSQAIRLSLDHAKNKYSHHHPSVVTIVSWKRWFTFPM
jgi:hypothetical protein